MVVREKDEDKRFNVFFFSIFYFKKTKFDVSNMFTESHHLKNSHQCTTSQFFLTPLSQFNSKRLVTSIFQN